MSSKNIGRIGGISGVVTWIRGEVPITLGSVGLPGHIVGINDAVDITPVQVKIVPPTGGAFGSTFETPIKGFKLTFGKVSVSKGKVSATYAISNLPVGVSIQLRVKPKQVSGSFVRDTNPQDAILELSRPVVENFNFHFLPPPK